MVDRQPPEPGMRYIGSLEDLTYGGLEIEIVAAARGGGTVVVTRDGVWWRPETQPVAKETQ